jgi:hypothetical protein
MRSEFAWTHRWREVDSNHRSRPNRRSFRSRSVWVYDIRPGIQTAAPYHLDGAPNAISEATRDQDYDLAELGIPDKLHPLQAALHCRAGAAMRLMA